MTREELEDKMRVSNSSIDFFSEELDNTLMEIDVYQTHFPEDKAYLNYLHNKLKYIYAKSQVERAIVEDLSKLSKEVLAKEKRGSFSKFINHKK